MLYLRKRTKDKTIYFGGKTPFVFKDEKALERFRINTQADLLDFEVCELKKDWLVEELHKLGQTVYIK